MKIVVIGDKMTCMAFSLGGIATMPVSDPDDAKDALTATLQSPDTGLVLITERVASSIKELIDEIMFHRHEPLIVNIPDTEGSLPRGPSWKAQIVSLISR